MAIKYKAQELYDNYVSARDTLEFYTGLDSEIIQDAIDHGDILPIHGDKFRHVDLASWMEQRRWKETKVDDPVWLKEFNRDGVISPDFEVSTEVLEALQEFLSIKMTQNDPQGCYYLRDMYGNMHRERFLRQFNYPELDDIVFNWKDLHEFSTVVMRNQPYVVEQISFISKPPFVDPTPPHIDIEWVKSSRRLPVFVVGVNLMDLREGDGGVKFWPTTHRIREGRMTPIPHTLNGFVWGNQDLGKVNIHNAGVIHATPPHVIREKRRSTFYVTICGLEDARNWNRIGEDNTRYVFND